jgi:hypothetical protein
MSKRLLILALLVLLSAGCNREPYQVAPVSGRLTLDGKPAPDVAVMFQPVAVGGNINPGPGSYGITDDDGRYSLKLVGKETPGAVVGKHKVRLDPYSRTANDPYSDAPVRPTKPRTAVPPQYNRIEAILEFQVPAEGSDKADFDMKSS